jgi:heat shock protein HslJ
MRLVIVLLICAFSFACNQGKQEEKTNIPDPSISNIITPSLDTNLNTNPAVSASEQSTNLYDIWVLDSINNKPMNPADYTGGTPYIEFTNDKGKFEAHSGCNSIKGVAVVKSNNFRIDNLIISKNACKNKSVESNFIKALSDNKASYKIENDKLYLTAGGAVHIFRRIRR